MTLNYSALVVDDNFFNRDIFRHALEMAGFVVSEAEDGKRGLEMLEGGTYDLIVLDLQMPKMDGRTMLRHVRRQPQHGKMHVLVVTANPQMVTDEMDTLADFVMSKPINVMEFATFAKRIIASR